MGEDHTSVLRRVAAATGFGDATHLEGEAASRIWQAHQSTWEKILPAGFVPDQVTWMDLETGKSLTFTDKDGLRVSITQAGADGRLKSDNGQNFEVGDGGLLIQTGYDSDRGLPAIDQYRKFFRGHTEPKTTNWLTPNLREDVRGAFVRSVRMAAEARQQLEVGK